MDALFFGDNDGSFFDFNSMSKNRTIKYPMCPNEISGLLASDKFRIPQKKNGEKRIMSVDVALMSSKKHNNDATAIFVNQMLPSRSGKYTSNITFSDAFEGMTTYEQALVIRKYYEEFQCDVIALDCTGVGMGIYDLLITELVDTSTGEIYPPITCMNDSDMADRCRLPDAEKVIWAIKASKPFNSECAFLTREGFRSGKLRLLTTEYDGEILLSEIRGYSTLSPTEKMKLQMPYINTTLLINELVKLEHEVGNDGKITIKERPGKRKDRYSSLSYNYYVAIQIEAKMAKKRKSLGEDEDFIIKPPKTIKSMKGGGLYG